MRLPVFLGVGALTTGILLLGGLLATELNPMPVVNIDAMEIDGASVLSVPLPEVSPRPQLVIKVSGPLRPGDWHLSIDGRTLPVSAISQAVILRVMIPGPLPQGRHHTVQLSARATH